MHKRLCGLVWGDKAPCGRPPGQDKVPDCWVAPLWRLGVWPGTYVCRTEWYHYFWGWWRTYQSQTAAAQTLGLQPLRSSRSLILEWNKEISSVCTQPRDVWYDAGKVKKKQRTGECATLWRYSILRAAGCVGLCAVATGALDRVSTGPLGVQFQTSG